MSLKCVLRYLNPRSDNSLTGIEVIEETIYEDLGYVSALSFGLGLLAGAAAESTFGAGSI